MKATYEPGLVDDLSWVRLLTGDRPRNGDIEPVAVLDDDEINAVLAEEANKYLAAARCGDIILARTGGVVSKHVGDLSITYEGSEDGAYRAHIKKLRQRGAELLLKQSGSSVLRVL